MDYETFILIRLIFYFILCLLFITIMKFILKKELNYWKIMITGSISGFLTIWILFTISYFIINSTSLLAIQELIEEWEIIFLLGSSIAEGIISATIFILTYITGKIIYDWNKKKKHK